MTPERFTFLMAALHPTFSPETGGDYDRFALSISPKGHIVLLISNSPMPEEGEESSVREEAMLKQQP